MALTWDGMQCPICGDPIQDTSHDLFALTMWGIDDAQFAQLDDAAMHQHCIDNWHLRDDFITYYNDNCRDELHVDRHGRVAYRIDWFQTLSDAIVVGAGGFFLLPYLPFFDWVPDIGLVQICLALLAIAAFATLCVALSLSLGWMLGVAGALGIWLVLDVIAFVIMKRRSP